MVGFTEELEDFRMYLVQEAYKCENGSEEQLRMVQALEKVDEQLMEHEKLVNERDDHSYELVKDETRYLEERKANGRRMFLEFLATLLGGLCLGLVKVAVQFLNYRWGMRQVLKADEEDPSISRNPAFKMVGDANRNL